MASPTDTDLLKSLQIDLPRGLPFDHRSLAKLGISSALAHYYLKSGWLTRLGRGVFMFPKDVLQRDACLNFLCKRSPGLHVGGKTALAWRGVRHNLAAREPLCLWAPRNTRLPDWFTERFPSRFTTKVLFSPKLTTDFALQPLPETPDGPPVSVPERALLEMLSDVGVSQGIEDARHIMEGARGLRTDVLIPLLRNCIRVKVVLLGVVWAEELALPWAADVRKVLGRKMGHTRWMSRLKDGSSLILKP